jgi:DNA polymerase-3 subunit gamma/tau
MALYNKYKPQRIEEILGQEIEIFRAICNNPKSGNAIIFTGPPGTGKTLLAHMYSRYINCLFNGEKPCNECENCKSQENIFETDGAVQTGIDSIRDLITAIQYPPLHGKYQIYVIDEAHMLSPAAKDALLLMLHNPPAHARIIFATTAIEKLPDTFVSRCIVFRVFRLKDEDILSILRKICKQEGKEIDDQILNLIIEYSDGSARKAISHLEPMLLCNKITFEIAKNYMNILDEQVCIKIIECCLGQKVKDAVQIYENLKRSGYVEKTILHSLLEIINNLYLYKSGMNDDSNSPYIAMLRNYEITNEWLANVFDILCKALVYVYQISGPSVKIPSILMMISTILPSNTLSNAVKRAFESGITESSFVKNN